MKDYEREMAQYQSLIESKDIFLNELQQKFDKQTNDLQSIVCIEFFKFLIELILLFLARGTFVLFKRTE
jgi:hypothetical protein